MYTHSHNKSRVDYGVEEKVRMSCSVWLLFAASFKAWNRPFWGRIEWMAGMKWVKATHCAITFLEKSILVSTIWRILINTNSDNSQAAYWISPENQKHKLFTMDSEQTSPGPVRHWFSISFCAVSFRDDPNRLGECFSEALICSRLILPGWCLMFFCYPFATLFTGARSHRLYVPWAPRPLEGHWIGSDARLRTKWMNPTQWKSTAAMKHVTAGPKAAAVALLLTVLRPPRAFSGTGVGLWPCDLSVIFWGY